MASIKDLLSPMAEASLSPGQSPRSDSKPYETTPENLHFTVEFILDTVCPHCYIGLRNLNTAIRIYKEKHPNATFEVTCSPIVLNPQAERSGKYPEPIPTWLCLARDDTHFPESSKRD